jgi:hypothetical protein
LWHLPGQTTRSQARPQKSEEATEMMQLDTWDARCRSIAQDVATEVCSELADEAGNAAGELETALKALRDSVEQQLSTLRDDVAQLRADIHIERSLRNGDVVDLPQFIRKAVRQCSVA